MKKNSIYLMRILIIDDSKSNTALLKAILESYGFEYIHSCLNKESTLDFLEHNRVGLILISSFLSGYSGLSLCKDINSDLRYDSIPILMVTADSHTQTLRKSFENGATDYIAKPINSVELTARVQAHLIRKEIADEKHKLTITDQLTKLYNRRYFDTVFETLYTKSLMENIPLIFFMIDIDNFKKYNDNYGHHKGDEALIDVSKVMKETLRRKTDYLFRLGGEEFSILLLDTPDNYCLDLSAIVHEAIASLNIEHKYNDNIGKLSISMGVCKVRVNNEISKFDIYNAADKALYEAKESGRNQSKFICII